MNKTLLAIILSLAAGAAVGAIAMNATQSTTGGSSQDTVYFDASAPAGDRIAALERIVAEERDARLVLEEQMHGLYADLERLDSPELRELLRQFEMGRQQDEQRRAERQGSQQSGTRSRRMRDYKQMRTDRLVAGGFTEDRAKQILAMEDDIRMDLLQAEYEAHQGGNEEDFWTRANNYQNTLRNQLGEAEYEKYLVAQGGQASVMVSDVIGSSPANRAGLKTGDRIISYDGNRVYTMWELKDLAFGGSPGEDVILDIERDGQRMQLVVPRGPLGISGNGANTASRGMFGG